MNKIRIDNLDIQLDREYHSIDEASRIQRNRADSLLSKTWFMLKLRNKELLSIYDGTKQVFIYVDNYNSMYGIHFYNCSGDLIMTYPWNGKMSLYNEGQLVNDCKDRFGMENFNKLTALDVVLRNNELVICDEVADHSFMSLPKRKQKSLRVFDLGGNEKVANAILPVKDQIDYIESIRSYSVDAKFISKNSKQENESSINF